MQETIDADGAQTESYFTSFTDMLIGVIFLFIIILLGYGLSFRGAEMEAASALAELQAQRDEIKNERDRLALEIERLASETQKVEAIAEDFVEREMRRDEMLQALADGLSERDIDVVVDFEKGVLRLPEALLFASGEADLTERGVNALGELAAVMNSVMPCYVGSAITSCVRQHHPIVETVLIEGHTDNVPIASADFEDNWALSVARGVNTYKALTDARSELDAMRNIRGEAVLGVSGYETRRPVAANDDERSRERNRRIDLRFLIATPDVDAWRDARPEAP